MSFFRGIGIGLSLIVFLGCGGSKDDEESCENGVQECADDASLRTCVDGIWDDPEPCSGMESCMEMSGTSMCMDMDIDMDMDMDMDMDDSGGM